LLVEEIVSCHGVPTEILSDRRKAFLSTLIKKVVKLLGTHRPNTTAYHPQTDGLVEWFNYTLTTTLAKTVDRGDHRHGIWPEKTLRRHRNNKRRVMISMLDLLIF